jgi:hypothetical protein
MKTSSFWIDAIFVAHTRQVAAEHQAVRLASLLPSRSNQANKATLSTASIYSNRIYNTTLSTLLTYLNQACKATLQASAF